MLPVTCSVCGHLNHVPSAFAGHKYRCGRCDSVENLAVFQALQVKVPPVESRAGRDRDRVLLLGIGCTFLAAIIAIASWTLIRQRQHQQLVATIARQLAADAGGPGPAQATRFEIGDQVELIDFGTGFVFAASPETINGLGKVRIASDDLTGESMADLIKEGRAFLVPSGTTGTIKQAGWLFGYLVQVADGDLAGSEIWIESQDLARSEQ